VKEAKTVEVVVFKLNDGVSREQFLSDAAITQTKIEEFDGYLDRQLLEGDDGQWTDIVWWESKESAFAAAEMIMQDESCMPFMQAINPETMQMMHLHPVTLKTIV